MSSIKTAILGYGKMGKLIDALSSELGVDVVARIDESENPDPQKLEKTALNGATVVVEFSTPEVAPHNLKRLGALGLKVVCGTTGWYEKLPEVREEFLKSGGALIYGANFSVGVNIFDRIIREAGRLMKDWEEYEAWGWEAHHSQKKDSPSGTLLKHVNALRTGGFKGEINIAATRVGSIPGTHEIGFDSPADTITLRHTARSREGFARGALRAVHWAAERKGVFEFSEVLFNEK